VATQRSALLSFNRGEVSKKALARIDLERMRLSAETQKNWLPSVVGPMMLRPGLEKIQETLDSNRARGIPFIFSKNDVALIELTDQTMRVLVDDELVTRPSVSTSVPNGDFGTSASWTLTASDGATTTISDGLNLSATARGSRSYATNLVTVSGGDVNIEHALRIEVERGPVIFRAGTTLSGSDLISETMLDRGVHSLTLTPPSNFYIHIENRDRRKKIVTSVQVESAGILELPTPWDEDNINTVRLTQSGDIIFLSCADIGQKKIERRSVRSWSIVDYETLDGPFLSAPSRELSMTASVFEGNGTLTASEAYFEPDQVRSIIRLFTSGQSNRAILAGDDVYTEAIRVSGVSGTDRAYNVTISGTWSGTLTRQRSIDGPTSGFVDLESETGNVEHELENDSETHNNVICWYRLGFKPGNYVSGSATVEFTPTVAGGASSRGGRAGIVRVLEYVSPTVVNIEVLSPLSSLTPTKNWLMGEWSAHLGYPSSVEFFDGRLWWAGYDRIWGSVSDSYYSFDIDHEGDAAPISRSVGFGPVDIINGLLPLSRLIVLREGAETSIRASSLDQPLTATNFTIKDCSTQGSARLPGVRIDTRGVFVQQAGRKVYQLAYSPEVLDYYPSDLTRLNDDIGVPGFTGVAVQRQPDTMLHLPRGGGDVAALLFEPDDEVVCWWPIETRGEIENACVLPGDLEDRVYYFVKRTIGNETKRFIERLSRRDQCSGLPESRLADCHVYYSGSAVTVITGLGHLEGEEVVVWGWNTTSPFTVTLPNGDTQIVGRDFGTFTVASGQITLPTAVTDCVVGLGYDAEFKSAKLAYGAQMGTALNQKKKVDSIGLTLLNTHYQGLQYGRSLTDEGLDSLPLVQDGADVAPHTVFSSLDMDMTTLPGEWDTDSRLCLKASAPRPCMVQAVTIQVTTNE
jgi:hypothetical protein